MKIEEVYGLKPGQGGLHCLLGVREVYRDAQQRVCVDLQITPQLLNAFGKVHGGTIAALCDIAIGCYHELENLPSVSLETTVHYYRPGLPESVLTAVVHERKVGKNVSTFLVEVVDDQLRRVADAFFTSYHTTNR